MTNTEEKFAAFAETATNAIEAHQKALHMVGDMLKGHLVLIEILKSRLDALEAKVNETSPAPSPPPTPSPTSTLLV